MRKKRLKLTKDQKEQGIIFSSTLMKDRYNPYDLEPTTHEVHKDDPDKHKKIERLKDDSFFNNSPFSYNLIRE